jgi:hypothetical protein
VGQVCWQATTHGRYVIDIALGTHAARVMIDLGLIDPRHRLAFELEPTLYDWLKVSGQLTDFETRTRLDASGRVISYESGVLDAQLLEPPARRRVGPVVRLAVGRGVQGVISRVGVEFFHHLTGCRVVWDLDGQAWCVDYP